MEKLIIHDSILKRVVATFTLWAVVFSSYMSIGHLLPPSGMATWIITPLDYWVPYVPISLFYYALAFYVPLGLAPWLIKHTKNFYHYCLSILIGAAINFSFFFTMPIAGMRPDLDVNGNLIGTVPYAVWHVPSDIISSRLMAFLYVFDPETNTFPSTHITYAMCLALMLWREKSRFSQLMMLNVIFLMLAIMTTKQHYFLDGAIGAITGYLAYKLATSKFVLNRSGRMV